MLCHIIISSALCGYLPVCSGGEVSVGRCGVGSVSGGVESDMREEEGAGSTGYGVDTGMGVVRDGEVTSMGPGVACEYMVRGVVVLAAPAGGGGSSADNGWLVDEE